MIECQIAINLDKFLLIQKEKSIFIQIIYKWLNGKEATVNRVLDGSTYPG
jgi:hypothetical protein